MAVDEINSMRKQIRRKKKKTNEQGLIVKNRMEDGLDGEENCYNNLDWLQDDLDM